MLQIHLKALEARIRNTINVVRKIDHWNNQTVGDGAQAVPPSVYFDFGEIKWTNNNGIKSGGCMLQVHCVNKQIKQTQDNASDKGTGRHNRFEWSQTVLSALEGFSVKDDCGNIVITKMQLENSLLDTNHDSLTDDLLVFKTTLYYYDTWAEKNLEEITLEGICLYYADPLPNEDENLIPIDPELEGSCGTPPLPTPTIGDILYWNGERWRRLNPGNAGQILATNGEGYAPAWINNQNAAEETDPVFTEWLATNPIPVIPTDVSAFNNDAGYLTELPAHNHDDRYYTETEIDGLLSAKQNALGFTPENTANKAQPNGYASLDGGGKIPAAQLPNSVMELQGNWNAATNTPTLADGTGNAGDVWEVSVSGTTNFGSGNISFNVGDWAVYGADGKWYNSRNSNEVTSVNGFKGTINLVPTDAEMQAGTNDNKASTPKKVTDWFTWVKTQAHTFDAKITFSLAPRFSSVTAGHFLKVDINKDLTSVEKIQPSEVATDANNRFVTDAQLAALNPHLNPAQTIYHFEDFVGFVNFPTGAGTPFTFNTGSYQIFKVADGTFSKVGNSIIRYRSSSNSASGSNFARLGSFNVGSGIIEIEFLVNRLNSGRGHECFFGLADSSLLSATNAIWFAYTSGTDTFETITRNSSGTQANTIAAFTPDIWHKLKIVINANASQVLFYLNGVLVSTHTNFIPESTVNLWNYFGLNITSSRFTVVGLDVDYVSFKYALTTSR